MATYAIGDLHGCYTQLQLLLKKIEFNILTDKLWFTGDLINRGPDSLETLRFVKNLAVQNKAITVLGNHDLSILAVEKAHLSIKHNCDAIFTATDKTELFDWLQTRPLFYYDQQFDYALVHAGILPLWDITTAQQLANEAEQILQGSQSTAFLKAMYGNKPDCWAPSLSGFDRIRFIINTFTRLRFCNQIGQLEFQTKTSEAHKPAGFSPWFELYEAHFPKSQILFGHWAALEKIHYQNIIALDTGCVWGKQLTALRLEDKMIFQVDSQSECQHR